MPESAPGAVSTAPGDQGCEQQFPTPGTSWTEKLTFRTHLRDTRGIPSFMIVEQTESMSAETRYRVVSTKGSEITALQVQPLPDSPEAPAYTIELSTSGQLSESTTPHFREPALVSRDRMQLGITAAFVASRSAWSKQGRVRQIEVALEPLLVEIVGQTPKVEARYGGQQERGGRLVEVFSVRVRGTMDQAATCHGRTDARDLRGELVLRKSDAALISFDLAGHDGIVEDVCSLSGRGRDVIGKHVADSEFHLSAACFAEGS